VDISVSCGACLSEAFKIPPGLNFSILTLVH
jgi:hypothetical protein